MSLVPNPYFKTAKRCQLHSISFDYTVDACQVTGCKEELVVVMGVADSDWREKVAVANKEEREAAMAGTDETSEVDKVIAWRLEQLLPHYDEDATLRLAERPDVDLGTAVALRVAGCSVETALLILL